MPKAPDAQDVMDTLFSFFRKWPPDWVKMPSGGICDHDIGVRLIADAVIRRDELTPETLRRTVAGILRQRASTPGLDKGLRRQIEAAYDRFAEAPAASSGARRTSRPRAGGRSATGRKGPARRPRGGGR